MSSSQGCNNDSDVIETFKEALKQRVGEEAYRVWFGDDVEYQFDDSTDAVADGSAALSASRGTLTVLVKGQFAIERLRKNYLQTLRGAAAHAIGQRVEVELAMRRPPTQGSLPIDDRDEDQLDEGKRTRTQRNRNVGPRKLARPQRASSDASDSSQDQPTLPGFREIPQSQVNGSVESAKNQDGERNQTQENQPAQPRDQAAQRQVMRQGLDDFVMGTCNQLAYTAAATACQAPRTASPLFLFGPTGTGKTHLLNSIADRFRRYHRMRRVVHLSAETFTNEFIACVHTSGLPAFRARYRDVDALIVDDIHFLGSKRATIREMLYTVQTVSDAGRPLIFAATSAPSEINGLGQELAGRLASGLVCPLQAMDTNTRHKLLRQTIERNCDFSWPEATIQELGDLVAGDGRVIQGVVNLVRMLHDMLGSIPTMDQIRQHGGELLRAARPAVTLTRIERAVTEVFSLPTETLRSQAKSRAATQPRMLAMYLSRQLTSCAYAEIGRYFGGRSHSTALVASKRVEEWLQGGLSVGRGASAISVREALDRIESELRAS